MAIPVCPICRLQIDENSDEAVCCGSCLTWFHKSCLEQYTDNNKEVKCLVCNATIEIEPKDESLLRNLTIVVEHTGRRIPVIKVDKEVTAEELLTALAEKIELPSGTRGTITRFTTHKSIVPKQSLKEAGIQDNEVLIADFERTAGGTAQVEIKGKGNAGKVVGGNLKKDKSLSVLFGDVIGQNSVVYPNYSQEFIITTADKLKIFLMEYQEALKARTDWITPLGILLALIPTLVAAEFRQFLGLTPSVWQAIFIIGSIVCFVWLIRAIYLSVRLYEKSSIDYIIEQIKKSSEKIENQSKY